MKKTTTYNSNGFVLIYIIVLSVLVHCKWWYESCDCFFFFLSNGVALWVEHATPGQEFLDLIPAPVFARYWLGRCQYNVTG